MSSKHQFTNRARLTIFFILVIIHFRIETNAQHTVTAPPAYYAHWAAADSLANVKEYNAAAIHVSRAFEAFQWRGTPDARFKAARIYSLAKQYDSAFINLKRLGSQEYVNYVKVQKEPSFEVLRQHDAKRFDTLVAVIQRNKQRLAPKQDLVWSNYLDSIHFEDQALREKFQPIVMSKGWDSPEAQAMLPEMIIKDSMNLIAITAFLDRYGWLGPDVVGVQGNRTLFLVIQHADSSVQEKYIPLLRDAVAKKNANPADLAMMEDRLSVDKNGYQLYGSQLFRDSVTQQMKFFPIRDEERVNERRKQVGLQPLDEYAKLFGIEYIAPGKRK